MGINAAKGDFDITVSHHTQLDDIIMSSTAEAEWHQCWFNSPKKSLQKHYEKPRREVETDVQRRYKNISSESYLGQYLKTLTRTPSAIKTK
nr:hypothetical protein [Providencia stuartii]